MAADELPIRSYRAVFELERRIHRVDRFRIPIPYGLPLRAVAYGAVALIVVLVAQGLPVVGTLLGLAPVPARLVLGPVAVSYVLNRWRIDGRAPHAVAVAWLRYQLGPSTVVGFRHAPAQRTQRIADLLVAPDSSGARLRLGTIRGPAEVVVRGEVSAVRRGRTVTVRLPDNATAGAGERFLLATGERLALR
jgi:hypothetical protein